LHHFQVISKVTPVNTVHVLTGFHYHLIPVTPVRFKFELSRSPLREDISHVSVVHPPRLLFPGFSQLLFLIPQCGNPPGYYSYLSLALLPSHRCNLDDHQIYIPPSQLAHVPVFSTAFAVRTAPNGHPKSRNFSRTYRSFLNHTHAAPLPARPLQLPFSATPLSRRDSGDHNSSTAAPYALPTFFLSNADSAPFPNYRSFVLFSLWYPDPQQPFLSFVK